MARLVGFPIKTEQMKFLYQKLWQVYDRNGKNWVWSKVCKISH